MRYASLASGLAVLAIGGCATTEPTSATAPVADVAPAAAEDAKLDAIEPTAEAISVGFAGQDPADIARYLLANGAQAHALSPTGDTVAFMSSVTGQRQLWTVPASGGQPAQLTFGNGVTFFSWTPAGDTLVYGADNNGNEQESYYAIAADGSGEKELMPAVAGGFRSFGGFSGDGSTFAYSSTERNGLDFDIYVADAETGDSERVYEGVYGFFVAGVSPDGSTILMSETVGEDSDNLYLLDVDTGETTTVSKPDPRANHIGGGVAWSADGGSIYMATNLNYEFSELVRYDIDSGDMTSLFAGDGDVRNVNLCAADDKYLVWTVNEDGFSKLHAQNLSTGDMLETPELAEGVYSLSCATSTPQLAIRVNGWATPGDVLVWNMETGAVAQTVTSNLAGLDADRLVRPESIRIPARDGVELQGLLYLPDASSRVDDGPPPVVFFVHGGPTAQSRPSFNGVIQYHVDRGVAVFQSNVRGSTGFGRTYVTLDDQEKRLDSVRDLVDMADFLRADGRVDMDRAAVLGGSYGGYMVNAVLANYPGVFKAGVSLFGVADWITGLEVASPALKASDRIEYGDITDPKWREFYRVNSPIRQVDAINVPVLYSHGVMDPRIDIYETEVMVRALRANGVEAPYIRIPDEGHGWRKLSNRLFYYRRQAEFLERVLGETPAE
ncbi:MAG: S9 family peptidase [Pseudomonadota bacterium]